MKYPVCVLTDSRGIEGLKEKEQGGVGGRGVGQHCGLQIKSDLVCF